MPQYSIDSRARHPAYLQLYHEIREDITCGFYAHGSKLPSKRMLAADTGTSVITVQHAYDLLADEGYIEPRQRSGYYVIYRESELFGAAPAAVPGASERADAEPAPDESGTRQSPSAAAGAAAGSGTDSGPVREQFPFTIFARTARRVLSERGEAIFERSPNNGISVLRNEIAAYLQRSRRIVVSPGQIIIGSGSEYLYNLIVQMLGRERTFALEDPSYVKIRQVYEASGVRCELLPMDREGIRVEALRRTGASVLHVTPFNSYPSGITATASRRRDYVRWALGKDRFIVEDDFDSEFSMSTKAEDTLYSLEPERSIIYMNTFSRTIAPAVRVGYMVLPSELSRALSDKISFYSCTVPVITQYVLAELLKSGDFERHINRVRRRRRQSDE